MTSTSTFIAVLLAVGGGVVYHISAKSIPRDAAPALVLVVAYAMALAISGLAHLWLPSHPGQMPSSRLLHPSILGLGLGAAMIELGYVLTYRAAWPVSVASVVVNGMVTALLVPVGLLAFGEHLSFTRVAGMLVCLAGVWLLRR
jgi:multidrug transporter EmrE-like cation transporter